MADREISELTAADTLDGDELVHVSQGGNSRKATLTNVVALSTGAMLKSVYDANDDGIIAVAQGGTNSATASGARTNLGLGTIAVQAASSVAITGGSVTGITDITVADGGTGASDASGARTNLGLVIGTDVQAYSANLAGFAATTVANVQNRVNHTGTQLAATISDFSTASDLRIAAAVDVTVQAYSATLDDWSAIDTADKLDASVIPAAEDGKILSWTGTSLVNKTAGDLGTFVVGEDVQAYSANLDDWSALATSAKQDASANLTAWSALATSAKQDADADLTTLASGTDQQRGDFMLPGILKILPKLTSDTIDLMLFSQAGVSPNRYNGTGSEALNNAAFSDALDAMVAARALGAHVAVKIPWGVFRIDAPLEITQSVCRLVGQGSGATRIITGDATIDMVTFTGGLDLSPLSRVGLSGVSLARDGTTPIPNGRATPKNLNLTNVQYGIFNDILIDKAGVGIYGARLFDSMFSQIAITGVNQSDRAGLAGIMMTAETGQGGACFGNHFTDFEIQYPGAGQTAAYTNGVLVECADGLYMHHGHILSCTNGINFNPDGTATIRDKVGGVWISDVYLDHNNDYGAIIQGTASNYGRLFFDRVRFSFTGADTGVGTGCRVSPISGSTVSDLEFGDCTFNESETKGLYVVNTGGTPVQYLKVTGSTFRDNNQVNSASHADIYIDDGNDYFIEGNNIYGGGAAGTGILVGGAAGAGTIENNDLSASTAGTKISIGGHSNGRKFVNNREVATGFAEYEREGAAQTTNATPLQVWSLTMAEDWTLEVIFTATASQSTKGKAASLKRVAVYSRATAGSVVEEGTQALVWGVEDDAGTDISLLVTTNTVAARLVGIAATTFNWQWKVEYKVRAA